MSDQEVTRKAVLELVQRLGRPLAQMELAVEWFFDRGLLQRGADLRDAGVWHSVSKTYREIEVLTEALKREGELVLLPSLYWRDELGVKVEYRFPGRSSAAWYLATPLMIEALEKHQEEKLQADEARLRSRSVGVVRALLRRRLDPVTRARLEAWSLVRETTQPTAIWDPEVEEQDIASVVAKHLATASGEAELRGFAGLSVSGVQGLARDIAAGEIVRLDDGTEFQVTKVTLMADYSK